MVFNLGNFVLRRVIPAFQRSEPSPDCHSQRLKFHPPMNVRKSLNLREPSLKKILSALAIRSGIMVERCGNLD